MIRDQLLETPGVSDRQIAQVLGVSHHTVNGVRLELEATNQLGNLPTSTGKDGKQYPRQRAPKIAIEDRDAEDALLTSAKEIREQRRDHNRKLVFESHRATQFASLCQREDWSLLLTHGRRPNRCTRSRRSARGSSDKTNAVASHRQR